MATIKSYTDIEQSKKLAEILPLESADMWWNYYSVTTDFGTPQIIHLNTPWAGSFNWYNKPDNIPCWSLTALLKYLSEIKPQVYTPILFPSESKWILQFVEYGYGNVCEVSCNNLVDACVDMIEKLHELKML